MDEMDKKLIEATIRDFPRIPNPFAHIGQSLGLSEAEVLERFQRLSEQGIVERIGPVISPNTVGVSTLIALSVPDDQIEAIAHKVNQFPEVNHNYEREHKYNLWFVVTANSRARIDEILATVTGWVDAPVLDLPMEQSYFIDLGFVS